MTEPKHIESLATLSSRLFEHHGTGEERVVIHCQDATYPIVDVHIMSDGSIGIEIALHEVDERCNCGFEGEDGREDPRSTGDAPP